MWHNSGIRAITRSRSAEKEGENIIDFSLGYNEALLSPQSAAKGADHDLQKGKGVHILRRMGGVGSPFKYLEKETFTEKQ